MTKSALTFLIFFTALFPALASAECLVEHLQAAIKLNTQRMPFYSEKTRKESEFLSRLLILGEKKALAYAKFVSSQAKYFHERGIMVFCDDLLPMS